MAAQMVNKQRSGTARLPAHSVRSFRPLFPPARSARLFTQAFDLFTHVYGHMCTVCMDFLLLVSLACFSCYFLLLVSLAYFSCLFLLLTSLAYFLWLPRPLTGLHRRRGATRFVLRGRPVSDLV